MTLNDLDNRVPLQQVADELGLKIRTLYRWKCQGVHKDQLPIRSDMSGRVFVLREDLDRFKPRYLGLVPDLDSAAN